MTSDTLTILGAVCMVIAVIAVIVTTSLESKRTTPELHVPADMEIWVSGTGQRVFVHTRDKCDGPPCVIHSPSHHSMSEFPTFWRGDRGLMERVCAHGVGHPDPDDLAFKRRKFGNHYSKYAFASHGCDGCCR